MSSRVLGWAREDSGYPLEVAAKRAGVTVDQLLAWEAGEPVPMGKLRKLGTLYRRPLQFFMLAEPPKAREEVRDFRATRHEPTPALIQWERTVLEWRRLFVELTEGLGRTPESWTFKLAKDDDKEKAGLAMRAFLAVAEGRKWKDAADARRCWVAAAEEKGVLVFNASKLGEVSEVRGLSFALGPAPIVLLNGNDTDHGRIFTLLHELVHLSLKSGGVCDLSNSPEESFCNAVAAAALMPRESFLAFSLVSDHVRGKQWTDLEVKGISAAFRVSSEAVLRRLLDLDRATKAEYVAWRNRYPADVKKEKDLEAAARSDDNGPNYVVLKRRDVGKKFIRVLKSAVDEHVTTLHSASQALGTSASTFLKIAGGA